MSGGHGSPASGQRRKRLALVAAVAAVAVVPLAVAPAGAVVFSNAAPITMPLPGIGQLYAFANPYPSTIAVSGLTGTVSDVNVTLCGFGATFPSDANFLVTAPNGAHALIMADVGGNGGAAGDQDPEGHDVPVANLNLVIDDQAANPLPADRQLTSGTWRPVDDDTGEMPLPGASDPEFDGFVPPAPTAPTNVALSSFNGVNPNGTWSLYSMDDWPATEAEGETVRPRLDCGWSIDISTGGGGTTTTVLPTTTTTGPINEPVPPPADFDGNGTTDVSIFRPASGTWFVRNGVSTAWGTTGDIPVPGDYDGDGDVDIAVFRPSTGTWFVQGGITVAWGTSGDIPVPGDYDGDGDTDIAVFRPSTGTWFVRNGVTVAFGTSGDIPVPGDYDGNGTTDIAVFRPSTGTWFVRNGITVAWGTSGDIPVPGDYDGNGTTDVAVFRPSNGLWFVRNGVTVAFGTSGDIPVPGDYDGNGTTDIAVFRPATGTWFVNGGITAAWGTSGDVPLPLPDAIRRFFFTPL